MRVRFLRPAEEEVLASLRHYTGASPELAAAFVADLDHAVALLEAHPEIGSPFDVDKRRPPPAAAPDVVEGLAVMVGSTRWRPSSTRS